MINKYTNEVSREQLIMKDTEEKEIELRSEEAQEALGEVPGWILRNGILGLFVVVLVLLAGSWFFKYPDTIPASVTLTSVNPPVHIIARATGKTDSLYVQDKQVVKAGDYLAVIENPANTEDVLYVCSYLQKLKANLDLPELPLLSEPHLGMLQGSYNALVRSVLERKDSHAGSQYVRLALLQLESELAAWKHNYVLKSPIDGIVAFVSYRNKYQEIVAGDLLYTILPSVQGEIIGRALLPTARSGKVKVGQQVHIRLANFPFEEFGIVRGEVKSVSLVPVAGNYVLEISLPKGLTTNYGKVLPFSQEMTGEAQIVTEDLRLLERIVSPIKNLLIQ